MLVGLDHEVGVSPHHVAEGHQYLHQQGGRVGLRMGLDRLDDLTGQPMKGRFVQRGGPLIDLDGDLAEAGVTSHLTGRTIWLRLR